MIKAVVFDMDGVILDSEKIYRKYEYVAAEYFGLPMDRMDEFCKRIAGGTRETNRKVFDEFFYGDTDTNINLDSKDGYVEAREQCGRAIPERIDYYTYRDKISEGVEGHCDTVGYELKPGVLELLEYLKSKGIKMALATSTEKKRADRFLKPHDIEKYFDKMIYGDVIGLKRGKPNPDIYLAACDALGVKPEEAIGVEDSINGIKSSSAAGLFTVMVIDLIQPDEEDKKIPDRIYDKITDIMELV